MKVLIHFAQSHQVFRLPELLSICESYNLSIAYNPSEYSLKNPFLKAEMDENAVKVILEKAILIKCIYELWEEADSFENLLDKLKSLPESRYDSVRRASFKFLLDSYGNRLGNLSVVDTINRFVFMPLEGKVDLTNPECTFSVLFDYGEIITKDKNRPPSRVFFGTLVGYTNRSLMDKYDLKKRLYIGTTSMDAQLSLIMANMAQVKKGSLVYDPFVGTGGIFLAAAAFGGYVVGSDIDGRQIRGKSMEEANSPGERPLCLLSNVEQYKLNKQVFGLCVFDITQHPWRLHSWLDAIMTDPPYGVRAGARKIGSLAETIVPRSLKPQVRCTLYPMTVVYPTSNVISDLLNFAAIHLKIGGRLVYWLPHLAEEDLEEFSHPSLQLKHSCEQVFSAWSRTLITMEKISHNLDAVCTATRSDHFRASYFKLSVAE